MGSVECPVCTLYLRADMSLEEHLETHPTDKVIKALVAMATKNSSSPAHAPQSSPVVSVVPASNTATALEFTSIPGCSSRSQTPPNALMYHSSGYESIKQTAPRQPPPPPPPAPMVTNAVPTAITVVKTSDVGYPINNVMIVKSCSTKFLQQMASGSGNPVGAGNSLSSATYAAAPISGKGMFIESERGGSSENKTASITVRRQLAPSLYPRYTNELYSGPPPPYSTAISSTISTGTQLQQSSITEYGSKYEQKQLNHLQPSFYVSAPSAKQHTMQTAPTITISQQQQFYQTHQPPPPPPSMLNQPSVGIHQQHQQFQASTSSFRTHNFLQAQYTEKEDGNFLVTENPKKIVEYTENDEGDFMVIEKIIKSPPRVVQFGDPTAKEEPQPPDEESQEQQEEEKVDEEEYEMEIDEEESYEEGQTNNEQTEQPNTIEIVEDDDGSFNDNRSRFNFKDMPKPMLIGSIGSGKNCNKFNFIVEASPLSSGHSSNNYYTPKRKPASGLKVLSNVKVTTDLSQGIKDIILNLNCKSKTASVAGSSGHHVSVDGINTSRIAGVKPAAVVNNNCQNELIINSGSNMPPIDLTNVNDIEIINEDEEDIRAGEDEECYIGSMEVKASNSERDSFSQETVEACASPTGSGLRMTPTPSVITSVIRMTPHTSPVVVSSAPSPPMQPTEPPAVQVAESQDSDMPPTTATSSFECCSSADASGKPSGSPVQPKKISTHQQPHAYTTGPLFNKQPKKLTVKLKTPLPPVSPKTPPLIPTRQTDESTVPMIVPKIERFSYDPVENHPPVQSKSESSDLISAPGDDDSPSSSLEQHEDNNENKFSTISNKLVQSQVSLSSSFIGESATDISTETITTTTLITTKVEQDSQLSETIIFTQSSSRCSSNGPPSVAPNYDECDNKPSVNPSSSSSHSPHEVTQCDADEEIECYKITFIDDEVAATSDSQPKSETSDAVAAHEVVAQSSDCSNDSGETKPKLVKDEKVDGVDVYSMSNYSGSQIEQTANSASPSSSPNSDQPDSILKNCIKIEKVEKIDKRALEELVANATISGRKIDYKVAKIEPSATVTSASACDYQKDQKDLLEAGPSSALNNVNSRSSGGNGNARPETSGPTFLEYSVEYDDYVPVASYGLPPEQIPLSWVQKFSPQYTPFDDQNSYMDLDMCSNKTNSNSAGGSSATCASGSGSLASRIDTSLDRAPSAESLNIRTDEKMPAKGEISEQESNGDMELSWNRLYPVHENIPIYPSSYDLSTAQECWNLSNRNHSGSHNTSSNSSNNNSTGAQAGTSTVSGAHQDRNASHHPYHHIYHPSQGINFQFPQHDQHRHAGDNGDDQVDDKSKILLDYGAGNSGVNYHGVGTSNAGMLPDECSRKLAKIRSYRCSECPKSFALLKQRRAHMLSEHNIDGKENVLGPITASGTSGVSSTITSGSALGFFSGPGEGSSTAILNKKIKIEPQPMLMSYSSLKQELEQKQEEGIAASELPGPSGMLASSSNVPASGEVRRKRTYVCGTCKQEFDRFKLFNAHLMTHPAECYTCGRSFRHWPNFALHIKRHLGIKDHQCRLCGKKFVIKQKLIEHMRVHTGKAPIKCPDCDQHFRRFSNLAQHRNRHHLNKIPSKKDFVCHCGEVFQSKAKMEWHKEIHENRPKSCPFCREKFIHKNSLTRHIRLSHTEKYVKLEIETETCTICNQPYIKTSMKRHMETHTEERMAYSCTICNKLFSTNWNLKQHKWTHANPTLKPFQCNMCSSGFVREADYITHMNAHKSIRPYTCNHCGCQFIRKYNWIRHTREHETDKNYTCEICGRKFHRKYYLTEHKRIHTGERPFSCNICGKTSSTKTNHNKHIKIHHARDPLTAEG
ncbi:uncharacterized protein LOC131685073 [Topomyia yanbarensis]|uniref:uncharacterized protein LOC131685073 n=1 Tax=Topomyia yanbarensis TaxID=2498891 RepID=UPI00273BDBF0|nr:uncharacterized protein LOC131685073 [Topomyia yanbarensis]XP_058824490.1 uncharacterized protein LOC131685073 [Topomyia yanbarensis]XP_058824500.1 uncharacterized protein LOC131685073 [Topomyia yanbarensis]